MNLRRAPRWRGAFAVVFLLLPMTAAAEGWMSFQGQTGLITVPDAGLLESQEVVIHANNEFVSEGRDLDRASNYILGYAPLPFVELSGRVLTNYDANGRRTRNDLSGNIKLRPLDTEYLDFAVGLQDFAGDAQQVEARYAVATGHLGPLDITLGYGDGPDRLKSEFGGLAWNIGNWGRVVADYDGEFVRAGLGARYRFSDRGMVALSTKLYSEDEREDFAAGLSLRFAFGKSPAPITGPVRNVPPSPDTVREVSSDTPLTAGQASRVADQLAAAGLSEVSVGRDDESRVIVQFENRRFLHNHLDGYQVVRDVLRRTGLRPDGWAVFEQRNGVPRSAVLLDENANARRIAWGSDDPAGVDWLAESASPAIGAELRLEPVLDSATATDFGVFDYDVALQSSLRLMFGGGLSAHAAGLVEGVRSDSYRDGGAFSGRQQDSGLDEAFAQWTHRPLSSYLGQLSFGIQRIGQDDHSVIDYEALLHSPTGRHQFHAHLARYQNEDVSSLDARDLAIGSYRFWWWEQDLSLSLSYGQFFGEDRGGRVILRRYIGDVIVGLFYLRDEDDQQFGGLSVSLPLTPRVGMKPWNGVTVTGQPRWQYSTGTVIDGPGNRNVLRPDFLVEPTQNYNLRRDFLDSDRALPGHMHQHWRDRVGADEVWEVVRPGR